MTRWLVLISGILIAALMVGCGGDKDRDKNKKLNDLPRTPDTQSSTKKT
jgi:hypothetical protein